MKKFCDNCEVTVLLTEDGYCTDCGKHSDNMLIDCEDTKLSRFYDDRSIIRNYKTLYSNQTFIG